MKERPRLRNTLIAIPKSRGTTSNIYWLPDEFVKDRGLVRKVHTGQSIAEIWSREKRPTKKKTRLPTDRNQKRRHEGDGKPQQLQRGEREEVGRGATRKGGGNGPRQLRQVVAPSIKAARTRTKRKTFQEKGSKKTNLREQTWGEYYCCVRLSPKVVGGPFRGRNQARKKQ